MFKRFIVFLMSNVIVILENENGSNNILDFVFIIVLKLDFNEFDFVICLSVYRF